MLGGAQAQAIETIAVDKLTQKIDLSPRSARYAERGDRLQIETAAGENQVRGRMQVKASSGRNPKWVVFALRNTTDQSIDRWLTVKRYNIIGSGISFPDLDQKRVERVTPSIGYVPERVDDDQADIFRITLEPGQTVTYVAEIVSDRFPRLYLWDPLAYEQSERNSTLFHGILLGLTGLLAIFLTSIFAANHKMIFPVSGLVAWTVLAYLCIDFGFWHKVFQLKPGDDALYRAAAEAAVSASLALFVYTFLRIGHWLKIVRLILGIWIVAQFCLIGVAVIDPGLATTMARLSLPVTGAIGIGLALVLAMRGQDRALSLLPTWMLFLVWLFAAGVVAKGLLSGDVVVSALMAGLVLVVVLLGFTVTQFAFQPFEGGGAAPPSEQLVRSAAVEAANAGVWEWNSRRDEIFVSSAIEDQLQLPRGELNCRVADWVKHLHPGDRERFQLALSGMVEKNVEQMHVDFRLKQTDSTYRWFQLDSEVQPSADHRHLHCVGLLKDITETKKAHEQLLLDAVHDNLTGLPNRELFLDRLEQSVMRARDGMGPSPTVMLIDIDRFKSVNSAVGMNGGDSMLISIARRLQRLIVPHQTLARVGGDQFALLLPTSFKPTEVGMMAERVRRALRSPLTMPGQELTLTGSIGIAMFDGQQADARSVFREAELAMYRAKRAGSDRVEMFHPRMRQEHDERIGLESDLRHAVKRNQIRIFYQPIVRFSNDELRGFEALIRWDHPRLGLISPNEFIGIAENSELIAEIGADVLRRAVQEAARWHELLPRTENQLYVSVNMSSRQLFMPDFLTSVRTILGSEIVPRGCLQLEVTESAVMENPEMASDLLATLKGAGARLAIDDFGTGYSSLSYLQNFPFDTIKVDKSIIQAVGDSDKSSVIAKSIVALGQELDKEVVAEGVEDLELAQMLRRMGYDDAQGFFYGSPMNQDQVTDYLKQLRKLDKKSERRRRRARKSRSVETDSPVADATAAAVSVSAPPSSVSPRVPTS